MEDEFISTEFEGDIPQESPQTPKEDQSTELE